MRTRKSLGRRPRASARNTFKFHVCALRAGRLKLAARKLRPIESYVRDSQRAHTFECELGLARAFAGVKEGKRDREDLRARRSVAQLRAQPREEAQ